MTKAHFMFNVSAAGSLRQALKQTKRTETVHAFYDDLNFGPIAPPSAGSRCAWSNSNLYLSDWNEVTQQSENFWSALTAPTIKPVIWFSRRSSNEYAALLATMEHVADVECEIIDLTDTRYTWIDRSGITRKSAISGTGLLSAENILRNNLLDHGVPLGPETRQNYLKVWRELQAENAPLRIVAGGGLRSAPLTYFDEMLLSCARRDWQKMALIVGHGLAHWFDQDIHQVGDLLLGARVWTLIDEGRLEARGGLTSMHDTEVRLPA